MLALRVHDRRHGNYRSPSYFSSSFEFPDFAGGGYAVFAGHGLVHQDEIDEIVFGLEEHFYSLLAIGGSEDGVGKGFEHARAEFLIYLQRVLAKVYWYRRVRL